MSSIPPVPPAIASAAGAIGVRDQKADAANKSTAAGLQQTSIEASAEGGDRDADGRDLREHKRRSDAENLKDAIEKASGVEERGGLDVIV